MLQNIHEAQKFRIPEIYPCIAQGGSPGSKLKWNRNIHSENGKQKKPTGFTAAGIIRTDQALRI
jgi:hypothetical protein